jgi:hypothetical protein
VAGENTSQLYASAITHLVGLCLVHLGRQDEATAEADRGALNPEMPPSILAELYALAGRRQKALSLLERAKLKASGTSNPLAVAEVALGNKEDALRVLEFAVGHGEALVLMSMNDIDLQPLWGDARFKALRGRLNLSAEQPAH